ncbi:MAG: trigger factor [Nitrospinota bacterium]|jgi:trigger factor|nr:trigger factor [Nitrospinota bacterium]
MRVNVEEIDTCTRELSIEVPGEEVNRAFERAYGRLRKSVRIPGFRKGKIPQSILERHYHDTVERDVLETLIPESYATALEENALEAVGQPKVDAVEMNDREALRFKATIEVIPPFDVPSYDNREFTKPVPRVQDEDVAHMLEHLKEQNAQLESAEDRPVQEGDYVVLDVTGTVDGVERDDLESQGQVFRVGQGALLPELEEALPGAIVDETRRVEAVIPDEHRNPELAGKTTHFGVTVREIKIPVYPDLNDEFARTLGEYHSLEDLRAAVREDLEKNAEAQGLSALKESILDALIEDLQFEIPQGLLKAECDALIRQILGMVPQEDRKKLDTEKLAAELDPQARRNIRQRILMDRIAEEIDTRVTASQVEAEVRRMAEQSGEPYAEFRSILENRNGLAGIEAELRRGKALDYIIEKSRVSVIEDERSVLAGHQHDHDADEEEPS